MIGAIAAHYVAGSSSYSAEVLADNPLAYYRLNELSGTTAADSSGHAHPGTYVNSPTLGVPGALTSSDPAVAFAAASSQRVNTSGGWANLPTAFALEAWVKGTTDGTICGRTGDSSAPFYMGIAAGKLQLTIKSPANFLFNGVTPINDNLWHHVVATFATPTVNLFVDGVLDAGPLTSGGNPTNTGTPTFVIGCRGTSSFITAAIDEVAIYNALSPARVAAHYAAR